MSREVKRVPLDFGWPLNKVWEGYLMPDSLKECPCPAGVACERGQTSARAWVEEIAQLALMLDDDMCSRGSDLYPLFRSVPGGGPMGRSLARAPISASSLAGWRAARTCSGTTCPTGGGPRKG